ncbi:MAG TPA: hypothetical protein VKA57_15850 [Solirubrobacteraceae bacterium]|nr:hypothetical protein [Solirubrobacteraceae bacterium]
MFGPAPLDPPGDGSVAALVVPARDSFIDPPALAVREDVLARVGEPVRVRAGGLADLVARIEAAGHEVETRALAVPSRRATPAALLREGSGRLWLFRRHPERFPLPRPGDIGSLRWLLLAVGALRANAEPQAPRRGAKSSAPTRSSASAAARQTASASIASATDRS